MTAHGALFGIPLGALLSLVGGTAATLVGFAIGRRGTGLVARHVAVGERARLQGIVDRYGPFAVAVSRPLPILAEVTAVLAGTTGMPWRAAALAGAAGNVIPAVVYAVAGARATTIGEQAILLSAVVGVSMVAWVAARRATA